MEKLKSFSNLPLGTRFRYPGSDRVYVILSQKETVHNAPLDGVIAEWRPDIVKDAPAVFNGRESRRNISARQNIFSHMPLDPDAGCPDMVEPIYEDEPAKTLEQETDRRVDYAIGAPIKNDKGEVVDYAIGDMF